MGRRAGAAVRLLPVGSDHDRRGAVDEDAEADRRADRHRDAGQHLPLRYLSTYSPRDQTRGAGLRKEARHDEITFATYLPEDSDRRRRRADDPVSYTHLTL